MTGDAELLAELRSVLGRADVDVRGLVDDAWSEAHEEVRATLRRLMTQDLLARAAARLGEGSAGNVAQGPADDTSTRTPASAAATSMSYLLAILADDAVLPEGEVPSLPDAGPLRLLQGPGCQGLVCDVDPGLFASLRDPGPDSLEVLADAAYAHDAILARFAGQAVLPLALGTAMGDDTAIQQLMHDHAEALREELRRFEGRAEWAVTVRELAYPDGGSDQARTAASGREYLQRRRDHLSARDDRWEQQERMATDVHGALAACALDARRVGSARMEDAAPPLLHGVYLLDGTARTRFDPTVTYLRGEYPDATFEVSGPWPPYHFVALDIGLDGEVTA